MNAYAFSQIGPTVGAFLGVCLTTTAAAILERKKSKWAIELARETAALKKQSDIDVAELQARLKVQSDAASATLNERRTALKEVYQVVSDTARVLETMGGGFFEPGKFQAIRQRLSDASAKAQLLGRDFIHLWGPFHTSAENLAALAELPANSTANALKALWDSEDGRPVILAGLNGMTEIYQKAYEI
ncbi:MAG: hypothetical protein JSR82_10055 [Verrucomicrobia bacterium]|nr:hypothetical protein [Verrucomicrobiota bacterium]